MITTAFYDADPSYNPLSNTDLIYTADILSTSITAYNGDVASPYYMGYILNDDFPDCCNISQYTVQNGLLMRKILKQNHSWGFWFNEWDSTTDMVNFNRIYTDNNNQRQQNSTRTYRFINSATMANCCYQDRFNIQFNYVIVRTADIDDNGTKINIYGENASVTNTYSVYNNTPANITRAQWADFIAGNSGFTIPAFYVGKSGTAERVQFNITVMAADLDNENNTAVYEQGNFTCFLQINRFRPYSLSRYYPTSSAGGGGINTNINPFIQYHIPAGTTFPEQNMIATPYRNENPFIEFAFDATTRQKILMTLTNDYWVGDIAFGHVQFDKMFSMNDLPGINSVYGYSWGGIIRGKILVSRPTGGTNYVRLWQTISLDDINKMLCMFNKIAIGKQTVGSVVTSPDYVTVDTQSYLVALFNDNNEPLYQQISGDTSGLSDMLQDWQQPGANITTDDFTIDDMPEYIPEEDADENTGDNIYRPTTISIGGTNGFVTQYALRASQVRELGQILWTSIFDSDYWKNYMFSLALDTGSFSLASLLSFFVSLRAYPFSMVNVPSYDNFGSKMYVGTGIKSLDFATQLHVINQYCDYLRGGWRVVWSDNFFGDWRDYVNAEYVLYVPYCGTMQLNPGDVVGNMITLQYAIDFATGGCIAYVDVDTQDGHHFCIGSIAGQIGADVPLTATAAGEVAARFIGDAVHVAGLVGQDMSNAIGTAVGVASGNPQGIKPSITGALSGIGGIGGFGVGVGITAGADLAPKLLTRGAVSAPMMSGGRGFASFGAPQTPYIQIRRGIYPTIRGLESIAGSMSAGTYRVGDLSGFVQGDVKTDSLTCPENEKRQIRALLNSGIYV